MVGGGGSLSYLRRFLKTLSTARSKFEPVYFTKVSPLTVKRDIDYMRDHFKAPIPEYDISLEDGLAWDGFYYTDLDFELRF